MAIYKRDIVDINLETGNIHRSFLNHTIGYKDQQADHFGIRTFRNGEPVDLTGVSVQGVFMPPQGSPIAITSGNIVEGNVAEVVLPQACYNYNGNFTLAIKLVDGTNSITGTMRIVDGVVDNTHASGTVAPTSAVPTYQEILSTYDAMVAATAAANGAIAAAYSSSSTYAVGDYCIHDGGLYRCTTAITTAEAWTSGHWTAAKIGPDVSSLKSAFDTQTEMIKLSDEITLDNSVEGTKYIRWSTGEIGPSTSAETFSHTGYVYIQPFKTLKYKRITSTSSGPNPGMAFYDRSKTYISGERAVADAPAVGYKDSIVDVPNNAVYARFTTLNDTETYGVFTLYGVNQLYGIPKAISLSVIGNLWEYGQTRDNKAVLVNGDITDNNDFKTTDYIPVEEGSVIYGYGARFACYDSDKTFVSGTSYILNTECKELQNGMKYYQIPQGVSYFRICANKLTGVFTLYKGSIFDFITYDRVGNTDYVKKNPYYNNLWRYGEIQLNTSIKQTSGQTEENADYDTTDYIPVQENDIIYGYGARFWCYDSEKVKVSGATGIFNQLDTELSNGMHYYVIPSGASYFRICANKTNATYQFLLYLVSPFEGKQNGLAKRKVYCLGDSITRGMYAEQGASSSTGPTPYGYPYWLGQIGGYTVVNLGVSGSGYANKGGNNSQESGTINSKVVVDDNTFSDADIITLAFGVNDWKGATQDVILGDMTSTAGDGTVIGNMKYCIEKLVEKKATAQIIVLLPINTNRQWTGMEQMTLEDNWAFGYGYRYNQTLEDYRNAIRTCANYYNVKVVDLEEICPINRLNIRSVCGDGLHPTQAFYKQMGEALAKVIA